MKLIDFPGHILPLNIPAGFFYYMTASHGLHHFFSIFPRYDILILSPGATVTGSFNCQTGFLSHHSYPHTTFPAD